MDPNIVYEMLGYQGFPVSWVSENLAQSNGNSALGPNPRQPIAVFRRQKVFQIEKTKFLHILRKPHGINRVQPLMGIVEQLNVPTKIFSDKAH